MPVCVRPSIARRHIRLLVAAGCSVALLLPSVAAASVEPVSSPAPSTPTTVRTIGKPGHALIYPGGLDVDSAGTVYVADTGNNRVERFDAGHARPTWTYGISANDPGNGGLFEPRDVAVTPKGLFVADTGQSTVLVLDK